MTKITIAIRLKGFSVDGFEGIEIRLHRNCHFWSMYFLSFDTCSCGKVQQNLAENLNII